MIKSLQCQFIHVVNTFTTADLPSTQYMMNMGLKNLFVEKGFTDPTKRKPMNVTTLGQGFKQLVLGPPQIIIETLDDNHTNLFYRMHLKSGKFHSQIDKRKDQNGDEIEPSPTDVQVVDYTINDWYYSFRVDLGKDSAAPCYSC
jgi:hypothetical protein